MNFLIIFRIRSIYTYINKLYKDETRLVFTVHSMLIVPSVAVVKSIVLRTPCTLQIIFCVKRLYREIGRAHV